METFIPLFFAISIKAFLVKDDKLLWEGCFKEINVLEKEILILEDNESCLGEKLVIKYIVSDKKFEKYPVVYKKKKLEFLSPVPAFLDCIMLHNYTQMKKLVSDDLIDFCCEKINDFCGDFDDYIFIENFCVLTKNFEAQKVLCFKISNNFFCKSVIKISLSFIINSLQTSEK